MVVFGGCECGGLLVGGEMGWYVGACKSNGLLVVGAMEGFVGGLGGKKVG